VPRKAPTKRRLAVDERRAKLLELGLELFANVAYESLSIDAIAQAAGISKGLLYHYFPSKRKYYAATVEVAARKLVAATLAATQGDTLTPRELLMRGLDAYLDFVERHGRAYTSLLRSGIGSAPDLLAVIDRTRSAFAQRVAERLGLTMDDPIARMTLRGWIGCVEIASLDWLERRDLDRAQVASLLATVLLATLAAAELESPAIASLRA